MTTRRPVKQTCVAPWVLRFSTNKAIKWYKLDNCTPILWINSVNVVHIKSIISSEEAISPDTPSFSHETYRQTLHTYERVMFKIVWLESPYTNNYIKEWTEIRQQLHGWWHLPQTLNFHQLISLYRMCPYLKPTLRTQFLCIFILI